MKGESTAIRDVPPYSKLASIYDVVMSHIDYEEWVAYLHRLCDRHEVKPGPVLDLSCGAGNALPYLREWRSEVHCMDLSTAMVRQLLRENPEMYGSVWVGEMSRLPVGSEYPLIVNLQDSLNYYQEPEMIRAQIDEVFGVLQPGGVYIFDLSTEQNIRRNFLDFHEVYEDEAWGYERLNRYLRKKRLNITEFYIWEQEGSEQKTFREQHVQRIYSPGEIDNILSESLFRHWWMYEDSTFDQPGEDTERLHVVLRKEQV